nr:hypothetical protein [Abalone asfa-like virus]
MSLREYLHSLPLVQSPGFDHSDYFTEWIKKIRFTNLKEVYQALHHELSKRIVQINNTFLINTKDGVNKLSSLDDIVVKCAKEKLSLHKLIEFNISSFIPKYTNVVDLRHFPVSYDTFNAYKSPTRFPLLCAPISDLNIISFFIIFISQVLAQNKRENEFYIYKYLKGVLTGQGDRNVLILHSTLPKAGKKTFLVMMQKLLRIGEISEKPNSAVFYYPKVTKETIEHAKRALIFTYLPVLDNKYGTEKYMSERRANILFTSTQFSVPRVPKEFKCITISNNFIKDTNFWSRLYEDFDIPEIIEKITAYIMNI